MKTETCRFFIPPPQTLFSYFAWFANKKNVVVKIIFQSQEFINHTLQQVISQVLCIPKNVHKTLTFI